jgi:cell division protein FtsB
MRGKRGGESMKYKIVKVGKTRSYGAYQNATIEFEAELEEGEQPDQVVKQLNEQVEKSLDHVIQTEHIPELEERIRELEARRDELNEEINKLADKAYFMRELLSRLAQVKELVKDIETEPSKGES